MQVIIRKSLILDSVNKKDFEKLLVEKGLSKAQFCKKVGITYAMLYAILKGERMLGDSLNKKFIKEGFDLERLEVERFKKENDL